MNERIRELAEQADVYAWQQIDEGADYDEQPRYFAEKFAELIVSSVLDEVEERAYYSGDRAWSDELDRQWVELEFGFGKLAKAKKNEQG